MRYIINKSNIFKHDVLCEHGVKPIVVDPWASECDAKHEYNIELSSIDAVSDADCIIVAVSHDEFRNMGIDKLNRMFKDVPSNEKVLIDVKGLYSIAELEKTGLTYWRL